MNETEIIAMWSCIASLGIKPYNDGKSWCYLYGEDFLQSGICGSGNTIFEAAADFYNNIKTQKING